MKCAKVVSYVLQYVLIGALGLLVITSKE